MRSFLAPATLLDLGPAHATACISGSPIVCAAFTGQNLSRLIGDMVASYNGGLVRLSRQQETDGGHGFPGSGPALHHFHYHQARS